MAKLSYHIATSLDGFVAEADGSFNHFLMQGPHVDDFLATLKQYSVALMGRKTYEVGLKYGVTNPYPFLKTYVFSTTMKEAPDPAINLVTSNADAVVRKLKSENSGDLWLVGSGSLAAILFKADLIDEITVKINPLLLGSGIGLVEILDQPKNIRLESSKVYDNGVVLLTYKV